MPEQKTPRALIFDVYGTVADWFTPLRAAIETLTTRCGAQLGREQMDNLTRDWRNGYARETSRRGSNALPWKPLVEITRVVLDEVIEPVLPQRRGSGTSIRAPLAEFAEDLSATNLAWRQLQPWPDTVAGLRALSEVAPIAPCSNGNFADMAAVAEQLGITWHTLCGAELSGYYKPHPQTYLKAAAKMGADPDETMMVACHQGDLKAAQALGLQTAFVIRPDEFGGEGMGEERTVSGDWTAVASDFADLAAQLRGA